MADETRSFTYALTFDQWKRAVNAALLRRCGMSADDLPDADYWQMWDLGMLPRDCADFVLHDNGMLDDGGAE